MNGNGSTIWADFAYVEGGCVQPLQEVWFKDPETIHGKFGPGPTTLDAADVQKRHIERYGRGPFVVWGIKKTTYNSCSIIFTKDGEDVALPEDWFTK
ncbi:MAG: hypothetical protein Q7R98_00390 [Candidatus Jorgensenbacteria bacterium]|nr:hypothetical protein [Candidatus Jorgensenbacteria bacterium]